MESIEGSYKELKDDIDKIEKISFEDLCDRLPNSFKNVIDDLETARKYVLDVLTVILKNRPFHFKYLASRIRGEINKFPGILSAVRTQILQKDLTPPGAEEIKKSFYTNVSNLVRECYICIYDPLNFDIALSEAMSTLKEYKTIKEELLAAEKIGTEANRIQTEAIDFFEKAKTEADNMAKEFVNKIKGPLYEEATKNYCTAFDKEATLHKNAATFWIALAIVPILILVHFIVAQIAYPEYLTISFQEGTPQAIAIACNVLVRAFIFAIIAYGLVFCAKNYMVNKHLEILNTHRKNALQALKYFQLIAKDTPETEKKLLLAMASSIFTHGTTGYLKKEAGISVPLPPFFTGTSGG